VPLTSTGWAKRARGAKWAAWAATSAAPMISLEGPHEGDLLIGTPFGWGRNLRTGEAVAIRLKGRRRLAAVRVFADEQDVVNAYAVMARDNHNFAKFNNIGLGAGGEPVPADLHRAWAAGARAFRLTPR
jgi:hypothetical protein